jgi:hypothetical protein
MLKVIGQYFHIMKASTYDVKNCYARISQFLQTKLVKIDRQDRWEYLSMLNEIIGEGFNF